MIYPERYTDLRGYLGDWETSGILIGVGRSTHAPSCSASIRLLRNAYDPYLFTPTPTCSGANYQCATVTWRKNRWKSRWTSRREGSSDEVSRAAVRHDSPADRARSAQRAAARKSPGGDQPPN